VFWPHGREKLEGFLLKLNSIHTNAKFTTESEREGHITFMDADV
jgi:hypothetical protein